MTPVNKESSKRNERKRREKREYRQGSEHVILYSQFSNLPKGSGAEGGGTTSQRVCFDCVKLEA